MSESLLLVDPGSGNLRSLERALERAADGVADRRITVQVSRDAEAIAKADRIVLPGQGHFGDVRRAFDAAGVSEALVAARDRGAPILGVCVGYQLFFEGSEEDGWTRGFGWLPGRLSILKAGEGRKVPHMGWNALEAGAAHPVTDAVIGRHVYFAHSYAVRMRDADADVVTAWVRYGGRFPAAAACPDRPTVGVQFHPEKSQSAGARLLDAFARWRP